jgi:DNA-binding XRE family transcriptional regulator
MQEARDFASTQSTQSTIVLYSKGTIVPSWNSAKGKYLDMSEVLTFKPLTLERAVGRVFTELRESRGLKQVDVSVAIGYVERTVGMIERGEKSPTLRTLENFASFYGVPLETIIIRAKQLREPPTRGYLQ